MNAETVLFYLLRAAVCDETVDEDIKAVLTSDMLETIYALASRHDLAHLVGQAVSKLGLPESESLTKSKQAAMQALVRYIQLNYAYEQACKTLEEAKISFIPLKGSVLRNDYPEPWMRTSCDIDILVSGDVLEKAASRLVEELGYKREERTDHDISMFAPNGVHLELHYQAVDEGRLPETQVVLANIWEDATPKAVGSYHYCMSDAMFYFYHIAHMAKHFENGGCGIRPFLDLWILNHRVEYDKASRERLISKGGLQKFQLAVEELSEAWFSNARKGPLSEHLERFTLDGGVYGILQNYIAVQQTKKGSKLQYALSKIFLPYDVIKFQYPILQKYRCLTPLYEVRRWIKLIFTSDIKRSIRTLKTNAEISGEQISSTADLMKALGL